MTYDIALWKPKRNANDSVGLIAITISEGSESDSVSRFPQSKLIKSIEASFGIEWDNLPFEAEISAQGATFGLQYGVELEARCALLSAVADELGLFFYDFQKTPPSESDDNEFKRRIALNLETEEAQDCQYSMKKAQEGSLYDMHRVGSCFRFGTGVKKDLTKAISWFEAAEKAGMQKALITLVDLYREDLADDDSLRKGLTCLRRGVDSGSLVALAMLAEWTQEGIGMAPDPVAALTLWQQLNEIDESVSAFEIAKIYEHGLGVTPSISTAAEYYRRARKAGHPAAFMNLRRLELAD
jgi:TPR repeat protein